jgi:hypothetical protein
LVERTSDVLRKDCREDLCDSGRGHTAAADSAPGVRQSARDFCKIPHTALSSSGPGFQYDRSHARPAQSVCTPHAARVGGRHAPDSAASFHALIRIRINSYALPVILNRVKDLGCERENPLMRWPDPSASPQDDKIRTAHESFRIHMTGSRTSFSIAEKPALFSMAAIVQWPKCLAAMLLSRGADAIRQNQVHFVACERGIARAAGAIPAGVNRLSHGGPCRIACSPLSTDVGQFLRPACHPFGKLRAGSERSEGAPKRNLSRLGTQRSGLRARETSHSVTRFLRQAQDRLFGCASG